MVTDIRNRQSGQRIILMNKFFNLKDGRVFPLALFQDRKETLQLSDEKLV